MSNVVISVENLSKSYRLGQIGTGTFTHDLNMWWAKLRGKPNPLLRIGEKDHGNRDGEELWALREVSFTVQQGEVLGIIGRNGAGKSTLLKILSRVTAPTSGNIRIKGRIASLLEVGTGFHPELTGRENIYLNGAILGMRRDEIVRKFNEIVYFSEVEKFIDTPVKRYSSGMYVRLAFAVAAYLDPEILIVDEVLAVGDIEFQKKCLGKMGDVAREGRTVLFVSHNMAAISALCDSGLLLNHGKIHKSGQVEETITEYLSSQQSEGMIPLNQRLDRSGNGSIRFVSCAIRKRGATISVVQSGSDVEILLEFKSYIEDAIIDLKIALVFSDSLGNRLFTCSMEHNPMLSAVHSSPAQVICHINRFPLLRGKYHVLLWSSVNGIASDRLENAFSVEVIDGDFYGSGKLPRPEHHGPFLVEHRWTAVEEQELKPRRIEV